MSGLLDMDGPQGTALIASLCAICDIVGRMRPNMNTSHQKNGYRKHMNWYRDRR